MLIVQLIMAILEKRETKAKCEFNLASRIKA